MASIKATIWASHAKPLVEVAGQMPPDGLERASLLYGLGRWENTSLRYGKALAYHSEALKIFKDTLGENHPDVVMSLSKIELCQTGLDKSQQKPQQLSKDRTCIVS